MKYKLFKFTIFVVIFTLTIGLNYVFADWQGPPGNPPTGNIDAPVNTGVNLQQKIGGLVVGSGLDWSQTGFVVYKGKMGIGTISPATNLHINQGNYAGIQLGNDVAGEGIHITKSAAGNGNIPANSLLFWGGKINSGAKRLMTLIQNPEPLLQLEGQIQIKGGEPGAGKVLTSDENGLATWQTSGGSGGDGLPTGTADQTLRHNGTNWVATDGLKNNGIGKVIINSNSNNEPRLDFSENGSTNFSLGQYNDGFVVKNSDANFNVLENKDSGSKSLTTLKGIGGVSISAPPISGFEPGEGVHLDTSGGSLVVSTNSSSAGVKVGIGANIINPGLGNNIFGVYGSNLQTGTIMFRTFEDGKYSTRFRMLTTAKDFDENGPVGKSWNVIARADNYAGQNNDLVFSFFDGTDVNNEYWKEGMRLKRNGDLHDLKVTGDVYARGVKLSSDLTLKENITGLSDSLGKTLKLNGVNFEWKDDKSNSTNIGFIAQEVEKVFPELVSTNEEGLKSVDYVSLVPVLVESIKDLDQKNKELESRIELLEQKLGL